MDSHLQKTTLRRLQRPFEHHGFARPRALSERAVRHGTGRICRVKSAAASASAPGQRALAKRRLCLLLELTVAMPGMPCVYYGDEAGMEGAADPFSRAPFPWGREDEALTALFRTALARKRTLPALSDGALSIKAPLPDVVAVERRSETQRAGVVINRQRPRPAASRCSGARRPCRPTAARHGRNELSVRGIFFDLLFSFAQRCCIMFQTLRIAA